MTTAPDERRTWFPLVLAGVFVVLALGVAASAYLSNRTGDPSKASTVDDVAELSIEAVERQDLGFAEDLLCKEGAIEVGPVFDHGTDATASKSEVTGVETGSFVLTVSGDPRPPLTVTVGQDGDRSCIEAVVAASP